MLLRVAHHPVYSLIKTVRTFLMLLLFGCGLQLAQAQTPSTTSQLKAFYLYNFTQFITWPPNAFNSSTAPFVIAILGTNPFGAYLETVVEGERAGMHPIVVRQFAEASEVEGCHLLFINRNLEPETLTALNSRGILTVGDTDNFIRDGGAIRFYPDNNNIRLQINLQAARKANVTISSKLLRLADVVD